MKRIKLLIGLVIIHTLLGVYSCKNDSQEQFETTLNNFLYSISNNNYNDFRSMIINESLSMNDDFDFHLLHRLYKKSINKDKVEDLNYTIIDSLNTMGQMVIKLPYFKGYDSVTAITEIDLYLYFGPKNLFPMNKLSNFDVDKKWNIEERGRLLGLPPTPKTDSIKKANGKNVLTKPEDW